MTKQTPPPAKDQVIDGDGFVTLAWLLHFSGLYQGDPGTPWTPTFQNLTQNGTPQIAGRYYRISKRLCFFWVTVIPGTDTSAVAGTTYIDNIPVRFTTDGVCFAVSGGLGSVPGHIVASNNRIYVPTWTTVTVPLTVLGIGEVQPND